MWLRMRMGMGQDARMADKNVVAQRDRLEAWEGRLDWPLTATAVLFLAAYAFDVLSQPHGAAADVTQTVMWSTWAVFAVDYATRLSLAPRRLRWFMRHLLDLAVVVLPLLRPLRLLRLVMLLSTLQRAAGSRLYGRVGVYVVGSTAVLVAVASLAMLEAERSVPNSNIGTYGQALWWAMVTITTVGYGDKLPLSDTGHLIAIGLMIAGIALLGTVTASLASWLVQKVSDSDAASQAATKAEVVALTAEVASLRQILERAFPVPHGTGTGAGLE